MKKIILVLLVGLLLTGCSYKFVKVKKEKDKQINELQEQVNKLGNELTTTPEVANESTSTPTSTPEVKNTTQVIERTIIKEVPAPTTKPVSTPTPTPTPTPAPVVNHSVEVKTILTFMEETIKAQQFYESAKSYYTQATNYLLSKNLSGARSANALATPLIQQAYNTVMNVPVPSLSGNCCSMSLVQIKKFYVDKYSCKSQWLNAMEQTIIGMEKFDILFDDGQLDEAEKQLDKNNAAYNIAENKRAECDAIDNQYSDVYKAMQELGYYSSGLAN